MSINNEGAPQDNAGMVSVLRNRNFLFLWLAQVFSQLAQQIINFAVLFQVGDLTHSSTAAAVVLVCFTSPGILFSALAGVFVDRQSKRKVLFITNIVRGIVVLAFIITAVPPENLVVYVVPIICLLTFVFSSVSQFFAPAEGTMIPLLVKRNELITANSLFNLTFTAAQLVGFVILAPILVQVIGYRNLYIFLFLIYVGCSALTWFLPKDQPHHDDDEAPQSTKVGAQAKLAVEEFKEGWAFIRNDAPLVTAIVYWSIAIAVFFLLASISGQFLTNVLHVSSSHVSFILIPGGAGLVAGVLLIGRFSTENNRTRVILVSMVSAAIMLAALALVHDTINTVAGWLGQPNPDVTISQVIIGVLAFFLGMTNSFITVQAQTVLQERSPEQIRARVFSAFYTISNTLLLVPLVLASALADFFGVVQTVVGIAVIMLIISIIGSRVLKLDSPIPPSNIPPADPGGAFVPGSTQLPLNDSQTQVLDIGKNTPPTDQIN